MAREMQLCGKAITYRVVVIDESPTEKSHS